jgi:hypothetical protein
MNTLFAILTLVGAFGALIWFAVMLGCFIACGRGDN